MQSRKTRDSTVLRKQERLHILSEIKEIYLGQSPRTRRWNVRACSLARRSAIGALDGWKLLCIFFPPSRSLARRVATPLVLHCRGRRKQRAEICRSSSLVNEHLTPLHQDCSLGTSFLPRLP